MLWIKMWTESQRRLPTYLLVGESGPNVVHACNFFSLNEYKTCLLEVKKIWRFWSCVSEDQRFWILSHVFFRGPMIFQTLTHVFRGPKVLDLGSCFQRTNDFLGFGSCFQRTKSSGSWLMFSEDQGFFGLWLMFSEDQKFWILAHVFRGPRIFGFWLMFLEDQRFFFFSWALAHADMCGPFTLVPAK